jgi:hypothetical protein
MNYSELVTAITDWTENTGTDFSGHIDDFIRQAEKRIMLAVQLPNFRKNATAATTQDVRFLPTPTDYLSPYSLAVTDGSGNFQFLLQKEVNFLREAYPSQATTALPKFYGLWDDNTFLLAPTPDAVYTVQLHYFYYPESIVTATTTWLGDNAENALLYGSLVEGYIFMKGAQDLIAAYSERFQEEVGKLKILGEGRSRGDTYRTTRESLGVN